MCIIYIYIYMYVFFFQKKKGIRLLSDMYACVHVCVCVLQIVDLSCHAILLLQIFLLLLFVFLDFAEEKMTSVSAELKGFGFDIFETTVGGEGLAVLKVD